MAEEDRRAFVTAPGDGQTVKNRVGGPPTFTARGEQTGGALTAFESTAADAFKKFARDAGMEVLGPPLAESE